LKASCDQGHCPGTNPFRCLKSHLEGKSGPTLGRGGIFLNNLLCFLQSSSQSLQDLPHLLCLLPGLPLPSPTVSQSMHRDTFKLLDIFNTIANINLTLFCLLTHISLIAWVASFLHLRSSHHFSNTCNFHSLHQGPLVRFVVNSVTLLLVVFTAWKIHTKVVTHLLNSLT